MQIENTKISGVVELTRNPFVDSRGVFQRLFCFDTFEACLDGRAIKQINHSLTKDIGVIRGMHLQLGAAAEYKIIFCLSGEVYDVALDLRKSSSTFLKWHSIILKPEKNNALLIPPGVAHGFQTLSENCELLYLHTENYSPVGETGINCFEKRAGIKWPMSHTTISDRDLSFEFLSEKFSGYDL